MKNEITLKSISYGMAAFILTILLFTLAAYIDEPFNPAMPKTPTTYHGIAAFTGLRVF